MGQFSSFSKKRDTLYTLKNYVIIIIIIIIIIVIYYYKILSKKE